MQLTALCRNVTVKRDQEESMTLSKQFGYRGFMEKFRDQGRAPGLLFYIPLYGGEAL
ncbi:hypothetical protein J2Z66_005910 [Paenibacillus eucommiae]|uniref:Uncharacterized protein n=1 Tax=Paenibacillus eucommiae TaxID=1355755 RepID=A0ABS4J645_9BACL|nr:hypothetical protein [Paenibacillus eucommiae]